MYLYIDMGRSSFIDRCADNGVGAWMGSCIDSQPGVFKKIDVCMGMCIGMCIDLLHTNVFGHV